MNRIFTVYIRLKKQCKSLGLHISPYFRSIVPPFQHYHQNSNPFFPSPHSEFQDLQKQTETLAYFLITNIKIPLKMLLLSGFQGIRLLF